MNNQVNSEEPKTTAGTNKEMVPDELPILTLRNQIAYPMLNMTLSVGADSSSVLDEVMKGDRLIGAVGIKSPAEDPSGADETYEIGTVVKILYMTRASDNTILLITHGIKRFRIAQWLSKRPHLRARITPAPEIFEIDIETEALHRSLRDLSQEVLSLTAYVPKEAVAGLASIQDPLQSAYIAAAHVDIDYQSRQQILEEDSLKEKLRLLVKLVSREKDVLKIGKKIQSEAKDERPKCDMYNH